MQSTSMSRIEAAAGRGFGVAGRSGWRCRQRRTASRFSGSHKVLHKAKSSMMMRRIKKFKSPYIVALGER